MVGCFVREEFEKADTWAGMIALATEVGAKKFSSEEETFSDLSILIFENNFKASLCRQLLASNAAQHCCAAAALSAAKHLRIDQTCVRA